jgi:Firmicute plasmid replication protein (RepL)
MTELAAVKKRGGNLLYKENPFMMEMRTKTKRVTNKRGDMMLVNSETGEIQSQVAGFWESYEVDSTKFVKLFVRGVKALKELTGAGTKVFEVLYMRVQDSIGKDQIYMSFATVDQTLTPMSTATYARGMKELIDKQFLAATPNIGLYWLNPSFVWNGDRLAFIQEYRKAKTSEKKDTRTIDLFENSDQKAIPQELASND